MIVVGLCGKAQVGKDTCAEYLVSRYGFKQFAFASYLKEVATLAGWNGLKDIRGRRFLNLIGDAMREHTPDIFIDELRLRIALYNQLCTEAGIEAKVVISDTRMMNEMAFIKNLGGVTCLILRQVEGIEAHKTETLDHSKADMFDYVLDNNGTFDQLYHGLNSIMGVKYGEKAKN